MPTVPKSSAGNGTHPEDASTMPTTAVNTISRLTLGLVSSRKSRHRLVPTRAMGGLSGRVGTMQGYHVDGGRRPKRAEQSHQADDQKGGACIMQSRQRQWDPPVHGGNSQRNLQRDCEYQQPSGYFQAPALADRGGQ